MGAGPVAVDLLVAGATIGGLRRHGGGGGRGGRRRGSGFAAAAGRAREESGERRRPDEGEAGAKTGGKGTVGHGEL
jgi:hypothetical protein